MRDEPIIIDSFAGGGGASTGIEMAIGRSPDVAINHDPVAIAMHAVNHPDTLHLTNDIWGVDPMSVHPGRPIGALWASPDCKHFSKAKGGKPLDRNIRDLAWVVVDWAEKRKPDAIFVENVEEFQTWGPVGNDGKPIPELAGQTFEDWVKRLKTAGYKVEWRISRACDYGAPTIRRRLLVIASRLGKPQWPEPTHGDPKSKDVQSGRLKPWRTAAECIDFSLACPSIFDTKEEVFAKHGLQAVRPLAENTMARAARGMKRYVLDRANPFLVSIAHGDSGGRREYPLDDPFGVVTAGGVSHGIVVPHVMRQFGASVGHSIDEPSATIVSGVNKSAMITPHLAAFYGHGGDRAERTADLQEPLRTVTVENRHALIAPHVATMRNAQKPFNGADEPVHTVTAGGAGLTLIAPSMQRFNSGATGSAMDEPAPTITANSFIKRPGGAAPLGIFSPVLTYAQQGGSNRSAEDPLHTVTASAKDQNSVIMPVLAGCGGRAGQSRERAGNEPLATITAKADTCVVAPIVAQHNNDSRREGGVNPGRTVEEPLSTVTASGAQQGIVAPFMAKYYGVDQDPQMEEPLHTITAKDRFSLYEAAMSAPPFTSAHEARARQVADWLRSYGFWDEREFVTITVEGVELIIVDVGMRMLTPRELFNAQGFPADYEIERALDGRVFSKADQVGRAGNSVSPPWAAAHFAANCQHLVRMQEAAE